MTRPSFVAYDIYVLGTTRRCAGPAVTTRSRCPCTSADRLLEDVLDLVDQVLDLVGVQEAVQRPEVHERHGDGAAVHVVQEDLERRAVDLAAS